MRVVRSALWASLLLAAGPAASEKRWTEALSSPAPEKRDDAERRLREAGAEALPAVAAAAASDDVQVRARARRVLAAWGWPTADLVARLGTVPDAAAVPLLAEALAYPAPVEMDPIDADLTPPEEHLSRQEGIFAAMDALLDRPRQKVLAALTANLENADLPHYYTLRALGRLGGEEARALLLPFTREDSTAGFIAAPTLARLGDPAPLAEALTRSRERIDKRRALARDVSIPLYNHACLLVLARRPAEETAAALEAAFREGGDADPLWARIDPDFHEVRGEAWFATILARYGAMGPPTGGGR